MSFSKNSPLRSYILVDWVGALVKSSVESGNSRENQAKAAAKLKIPKTMATTPAFNTNLKKRRAKLSPLVVLPIFLFLKRGFSAKGR